MPKLLQDARRYTRSEVEAANVGAALLEHRSSWKKWIEKTLLELLEVSRGSSLSIVRSSEIQNEQKQTYSFSQNIITIGRAAENDVSLPLRSISRKHAQIVRRNNEYFIEDLESASGTYVNHQKLQPGQSRQLRNGDQFLIVPYTFEIAAQELWEPETDVVVTFASRLIPGSASAFLAAHGADLCLFQVVFHPDLGQAVLAISRPFLMAILSRLTRDNLPKLVESDAGLLEFVVVSILECMNRELQFPFQCSLVSGSRLALREESGLVLDATLKLQGAHGYLALFLPEACVRKMGKTRVPHLSIVREELNWRLPIRFGFAVLDFSELENLEPGDTLLYTKETQIVLPGMLPERGWDVEWTKEQPSQLAVKSFFERSGIMVEDRSQSQQAVTEPASEVKLESLPVRVDVVLSEVELFLGDLEALREGSVIEIGEIPEEVQLVVNGKILGAGELVSIEDRLGVSITSWRKS